MPSLKERLKGSNMRQSAEESPLLGVRQQVKQEVLKAFGEMKNEMMAEFQRMMREKMGEGMLQLKGERGYTPKYGVDFLTPKEVAKLKKELRGRDGMNGRDGLPGKDADIETIAKDVMSEITKRYEVKIKELKVEDIIGLKELLQTSRPKRGGGGGGGKGNTIHEHKSVSSATTTVSTASKIAGAGYALQVFYNGQFIARGTDYTVGTDYKTITLLFTPQDSTVIDIVYERA